MKLLAFGEVLWDVYPDKAVIGGASLNFAGHFAMHGGDAYLISSVGKDDLGEEAIRVVESYGINSKYIASIEKQTGKCLVTLDENKVPSYNLLDNVAYDFIGDKIEQEFDVLYFGTLSQRNEFNRNSLKTLLEENNFKEVFCDVNIRPPFYSENSVKLCVNSATVIKISDEELPIVSKILFNKEYDYKEFARNLAKAYKNLKVVIITRGPEGAFVLDAKEGKECEMKSPKTNVISTVGAGDSFSAAFMYKYMLGEKIENCLANAVKVSSFVVANLEAIPKYPENFI